MDNKKLPIGYWIRQVDQLLTKGIDSIQASFGLTRGGWQILNTLAEASTRDKAEMLHVIKPFLDETAAEAVLLQLIAKELINSTRDGFCLTDKGREQYKDCLELQTAFRQKTMQNVPPENYQITVKTLQQIVENLDS